MEKLGPLEKVFEAWTAIEDGRVRLEGDHAVVRSSDDSKEYTVRFDGDLYSSDDNATYWRGYAGYPVIAVLMLQGRLPFVESEAALWKGVGWKTVNTKFKNRYAEAVASVAAERGINLEESRALAREVMDALAALDIRVKRKI